VGTITPKESSPLRRSSFKEKEIDPNRCTNCNVETKEI
jgi:hypothetical protein